MNTEESMSSPAHVSVALWCARTYGKDFLHFNIFFQTPSRFSFEEGSLRKEELMFIKNAQIILNLKVTLEQLFSRDFWYSSEENI